MRAYICRAVAPAVLLSALAMGCSGEAHSDKGAPKPSATAEAVVEEPSQEPSETPSSSAPAPELGVGERGEYVAVDSADESVKTKMSVAVKGVKYVQPADIDTTNEPVNGQFVVLTLTVKNVGDQPGGFAPYGVMMWQDDKTAAQDATTLESTGGQDVDATYQPGQSVTGDVVLDVVRKGGTVSYFDAPGDASFVVKLPTS
jgi:archaellum component FlaG (FlaF/FlaG flagellin family)